MMIGNEPARTGEPDKLGFRLAGFQQWPLDKSLSTLAEIGYRSVELCLEHPELDPERLNAESIARIKTLLAKMGLRVSSVSYHAKRDNLQQALKKQRLALDVAREFGVGKLVIGTVASSVDPEGSTTYRALEELVQAADGKGVTVAIEPEPDTVIHGMYEFSILASTLSGCPLGLNLDLGHAYLTENNVAKVIAEWAPFIAHVHLEDIRRPDHVHLLPGDGQMELAGLVHHLREHGYTGDLTVDLFDILDAPDEWAKNAMQRCRELLK